MIGIPRSAIVLATLALLAARPGFPAAAAPVAEKLVDGTRATRWTLANGLRVTTRDIPGARAVAVTVAYGNGTEDDPPGRDGLAQVLCELGFTAPAGDLPARSRDELDSQRPLGWSLNATRHSILYTEVAAPAQFPGMLRQVALRMGGVQITQEELAAAVRTARQQMEQQVSGATTASLYFLAREAARGTPAAALERHRLGSDLDGLELAEAEEQLKRRLSPANAALSIAGDLSGVDTPALVRNLFQSLPGGTPLAHAAPDTLRAGNREIETHGGRLGWAIGIIAPAVDDTLHPAFYLGSLLLGSHFRESWAAIDATRSPFFYAPLDEPDLARVFPPPSEALKGFEPLSGTMASAMNEVYQEVFTQESYDEARDQALWLMGGPIDGTMMNRLRRDPAALQTLARSMAACEIQGGEAFWGPYRERFAALQPRVQTWADYYTSPRHQVRVIVHPSK